MIRFSCQTGTTSSNELAQKKGSCQLSLSEYLGFQSEAPLSKFQMNERNVYQDEGRKRGGQEAEFQERVRKKCVCLGQWGVEGILWPQNFLPVDY